MSTPEGRTSSFSNVDAIVDIFEKVGSNDPEAFLYTTDRSPAAINKDRLLSKPFQDFFAEARKHSPTWTFRVSALQEALVEHFDES